MGINLLLICIAIFAAVAVYFSISVSSVMITINVIAVAMVVGIEVTKLATPDGEYDWVENRKFAFINLAAVLVAANLSVLYFMKNIS